jgi:hypothetical protein
MTAETENSRANEIGRRGGRLLEMASAFSVPQLAARANLRNAIDGMNNAAKAAAHSTE